ncbi:MULTISPECIES: Hsp20 family protein [Acinetobacter]|jgi:molecular chaperone IbpA|uniref:Hsp20 family protein n=1 Tax=Acinetobacter TaxID=469 RepID=UPI00066234AE|nr:MULTISPECIES: Hsp20 family protein [Acinetobacter]KMU99969.1 heat-shock protein [Acinetobacter sp. VT 511]MBB4836911.1 molecular chaperone IbpA [Acinetobacter schindleri]PUQ99775.1 heat-shock protein [Acinetobacter schindleri]WBX36823.1 Hsp20 family protein [Acinetobacter schindleri]
MSNFSLSSLFRRSIGFDHLSDLFDFALQSDTPNYPHYNIEKTGDNNYRISVATAGFNQDQLEINLENKVLTITGKVVEENDPNVEYLYKGIASRSFKLSLRLDEHVEVQQADYDNGLLTIDLQRRVPDEVMAR